MPTEAGKGGLSLVDYAREKRREGCPVCALPDAIRGQMANASDKKIKRSVVLDWLREEHAVDMADQDVSTHINARHDRLT